MELRHFKLVKVVSELGTLSKASKVLHLSQSALSHQLKELESEIGFTVFRRTNKKLILSETGEIILNYSKKILLTIDELESSLKKHKGEEIRQIRIALEAYTSYHWLPAVIANFHKYHPLIEVVISTESGTMPLQLMENKELDYAIMVYKYDDLNFEYYPLFDDELVVVVSKSHPFSSKDYIETYDLENEIIITHSKKNERNRIFERKLKNVTINPKKFIQMNNTNTVLEMVDKNIGIAVLSKWAISNYISSLDIKCIKLGENGLFRKWYLVKFKNLKEEDYKLKFTSILKKKLLV